MMQFSKPSLRRVVAMAVLALTSAGCIDSAEPPSAAPPESPDELSAPVSPAPADPAPGGVSVDLLDGPGMAEVLENRRGRVVLVDFWATWCSSCVEQFPHTVELHQRLAERGLSVVSVSLNEPEEKDAVLEFLESKKATLANYISRHGGSDKSMEAFDLEGGLPHYKLYDRQGKLHRTFAPGAENLDPHDIDVAIETLLGP